MNLESNPNYYNYIHSIHLSKNNECNFMYGSGQSIFIEAKGKYEIFYENKYKNKGYFIFKINSMEIKSKFYIEIGLFVLMNEIIWDSYIENWPFSVFHKRYVFDEDPFDRLYEIMDKGIFLLLEKDKETQYNKKIFYSRGDIIEKEAKDLNKKELNILKKLNFNFYDRFISNPKEKI